MKTDTLNLAAFAENPDNPSVASDDAIARLMKKLRKVPDGLKASRIAYVTDYVTRMGVSMSQWLVVLSGNKRLRALKEIYGESADVPAEWFQDVTGLTPAQRREFIINMNVTDGEWIASRLMSLYTKTSCASSCRKTNSTPYSRNCRVRSPSRKTRNSRPRRSRRR